MSANHTDNPPNLNSTLTQINASVRQLHLQYAQALWEAATTGAEEANQRETEAQAALMRFWSDKARYAQIKALHDEPCNDPLLARQLELVYLSAAKAQQDEETIDKITSLEEKVRAQYYNYRAEIHGQALSDNEIDNILKSCLDAEEVRTAWEGSKKVGRLVAAEVRELAHLRNQAARAQGYRDHFQRALALSEIDEAELFDIYDRLEEATSRPYQQLKAEIDTRRANIFGIPTSELRPWHYGDRFFQTAPDLSELDLDGLFADQDLQDLAIQTCTGLDMLSEPILHRSDLYPRKGKNQHAFCLDLDREEDIRILCNLQPTRRWTETLLHELGHACYDLYLDHELPWIMRRPAHALTTEGVAILMGALSHDKTWLQEVLGLAAEKADQIAAAAHAAERTQRLVFIRWCMVMTHFDRALYQDPDGDLNCIWWDLVEKYQSLTRPDGRDQPDWAAKYHVALVPVYYHNYALGQLLAAHLEAYLQREFGGLCNNPEAGKWLKQHIFQPATRLPWNKMIAAATGEDLNPDYFRSSIG